MTAPASRPVLHLRITATAETLIRGGHPWLFSESIREQNRPGKLGELAIIFDRKDKFLAVGLFDPESPIRVRMLHAGKPIKVDHAFWSARLKEAFAKRGALFDAQTTGYRCINGESDGFPGLVVDRYDTTLVLKIYSGIWFDRVRELAELMLATAHAERIVMRLSRNIQKAASRLDLTDGSILHGPVLSGPVIFLENGLRFEADVVRGQKTGFFLDQRENRQVVESLAAGRDVLNAFSFSGGFSLYAARGGAKSVTNLDISAHALESARRNVALNEENPNVARCRKEDIQADVFEWLRKERGRKFDLIILDPPSLAKREVERHAAISAYEKLAGGGIDHLARGGVLVCASCSAHVSADEFFAAVRRAARASGRIHKELRTTRHAPDHHAAFKEAEYLKCIYLQFESRR